MKIDSSFKNYIANNINKITKEARYTLKGKKIIRLSDGMKGIIVAELLYGKGYKIEWEDGKTQKLGRSTILDKKRYNIIDGK